MPKPTQHCLDLKNLQLAADRAVLEARKQRAYSKFDTSLGDRQRRAALSYFTGSASVLAPDLYPVLCRLLTMTLSTESDADRDPGDEQPTLEVAA